MDVGRIMNEKTACSQIIGSVIFGIGAALMEATEYDKLWGNPVVRTLADYHIPVHLDVPLIDVHFIGKPDPHISPIGAGVPRRLVSQVYQQRLPMPYSMQRGKD